MLAPAERQALVDKIRAFPPQFEAVVRDLTDAQLDFTTSPADWAARQVVHHAAELLADLHGVRADKFGFDRETVLAGISQKTAQTNVWIEYFRQHRLLYMAGEAARSGRLPASMLPRIEVLSEHLGRWLEEPEHPSLIHGDVWTTNVLAHNGRITAFLDPAIYYAHPEIELAFITLFNTFGAAFFETYHALRPIEPGFFETRRDLYNLYPLLTHVRRFGF